MGSTRGEVTVTMPRAWLEQLLRAAGNLLDDSDAKQFLGSKNYGLACAGSERAHQALSRRAKPKRSKPSPKVCAGSWESGEHLYCGCPLDAAPRIR